MYIYIACYIICIYHTFIFDCAKESRVGIWIFHPVKRKHLAKGHS